MNDAAYRCTADPVALAYIRKYYTPTGALEDPVIAVHTTYDPGVPPYLTNLYSTTTALEGSENWFVQKWVEADGHCNIAPALMGKAFDQLRRYPRASPTHYPQVGLDVFYGGARPMMTAAPSHISRSLV